MPLASLPVIHSARLPETYSAARQALAECSRIDECQDWADKAEALASYARQSKDEQLRRMADRIQARAIRRCGELLKTFRPAPGTRIDLEPRTVGEPRTITEFAMDANLSGRQRKTALQVANIPTQDFEAAVESEHPPTITKLAEAGKKSRPLVDLGGIDPKEYALSTDGQDQLRRLAQFAERIDAGIVARGSMPHERRAIRSYIGIIDGWLDQLIVQLED